MIDAKELLKDLQRQVRLLEDDLRDRSTSNSEIHARLAAEYEAAIAAGRTGEAFEPWRDQLLVQAAVAWALACVFVRFLEDNGLIAPVLSGPTPEARSAAKDQEDLFFQAQPTASYRDYLEQVFRGVEALPGMRPLFDHRHNLLWSYPLSGDAAKALLGFFRAVSPDTGQIVHDFHDPDWNTRFLGDLYQDLSEAVRKRYALLQTPEFVEEFILDRTLEPAIQEFGLAGIRMIDPTCGSGHFLLGGFQRVLDKWFRQAPDVNERELAQRALDSIYGVDLNPYAVAIARFRLLVAAIQVSGIRQLKEAPDFRINLAVGDSLLHGKRFDRLLTFSEMQGGSEGLGKAGYSHTFRAEDLDELNRILGQQYHAVVGNPPYITASDAALNAQYRELYSTCHRKYSLGVPFTERFFDLALFASDGQSAGFVGMITADSFMKREFGKKLIEDYLPTKDLTHVISTSGAYIPGHGTPTVTLFGRHRSPAVQSIRVVMGIKGEPSTPDDPAQGLVWRAILAQVDEPGSSSEFISVAAVERSSLAKHPWSIGGGGAAELKDLLEAGARDTLGTTIDVIGRTTHTGEDDVYYRQTSSLNRYGFDESSVPLVIGEDVRDYVISSWTSSLFPYDKVTADVLEALEPKLLAHFWLYRSLLKRRRDFGQTIEERGLKWYEHSMFFPTRFRHPLSIVFAFVATHNHFVLDRGGKVFNRSAPVIKLSEGASEDDHLALLGILNSSTACFWMKQVFFPKGGDQQGSKGARVRKTLWDERYEFAATGLQRFPLPEGRPLELARQLDALATERQALEPVALIAKELPTRDALDAARLRSQALLEQMIALQEELDWQVYRLYGLLGYDLKSPPPPRCQTWRARVRDRHGPPDGRRQAIHHLVRAPRRDAHHRDPRALA